MAEEERRPGTTGLGVGERIDLVGDDGEFLAARHSLSGILDRTSGERIKFTEALAESLGVPHTADAPDAAPELDGAAIVLKDKDSAAQLRALKARVREDLARIKAESA